MKYFDALKNLLSGVRRIFGRENIEVQPRDILMKLFREMEQRRKFGIEEKAYVPNVYTIYLSPFDFEEISPLICEIKEQLKNKLVDRVKKKGYKILSPSLVLEIRDDAGLAKNQIVIESSFMKEKSSSGASMSRSVGFDEKQQRVNSVSKLHEVSRGAVYSMEKPKSIADQIHKHDEREKDVTPSSENKIPPDPSNASGATKVIEDKKTKLVDLTRVWLEVIKGKGQGGLIALKDGEYSFGRGQEAEYLLEDQDDTVSRLHFKLIVRDERIRIKDLGSLNGTCVNDIAIEETELQKGDLISAGKLLLKVA